jgi:hypothetical protein
MMNDDDPPQRQGEADGSWFTAGRFAIILGVLIFIPFWDVLLGQKCFVVRDFGLFSYPVAYFHRESFWHGQVPLWNPYDCCGLPFLAQLNTLVFYPPSLIYLLLPLPWSLPVFCLLHLFAAGMGMYVLAWRWSGSRAGAALAGLIFAFNGLSLNFLMWPSHIATFALMPWVIALTEEAMMAGGRAMVGAAIVAGFQVLAGGPETILFTWLVLLAVAMIRMGRAPAGRLRLARRFAGVGLLALALAAIQLLPFADLSAHSNRGSNFANSAWSMPPYGWANFLAPLFQTYAWQQIVVQQNQYWTSSYYAGIGTVFLAVVAVCRQRAWRVWLLGVLLAASLILALGDYGFLYSWLRRIFPFLGLFRYPIKFVILTMLALPVLAAFAVGGYERPATGAGGNGRLELVCAGGMVVLVAGIVGLSRGYLWSVKYWVPTAINAGCRVFFLALILGILYWFATRPAGRARSGLMLMVVFWLDVLTHAPWQNPTVDPSVYQPGLPMAKVKLDPAPRLGESRLMMSPYSARQMHYTPASDVRNNYLLDRVLFFDDCNLLDKMPKVDGFFSLYLRESDRVISLFTIQSEPNLPALEDFLSVSHTIAPGKVFDWSARPSYMPWVTAGQQPEVASDDKALAGIAERNVNLRNVVFLPVEAGAAVRAAREPGARIISQQFGVQKAIVTVESPGPTMVVISQAYYHDWKARVDGRPTPLWRANYAFQAVEVSAGRHQVQLDYEDRAFQAGAIISGLAVLACAAGWLRIGARQRRLQ